jgi:hypothetical protein
MRRIAPAQLISNSSLNCSGFDRVEPFQIDAAGRVGQSVYYSAGSMAAGNSSCRNVKSMVFRSGQIGSGRRVAAERYYAVFGRR